MRYGFIGLGNMASAILRGMKKTSDQFDNDEITGFDINESAVLSMKDEIGLLPCRDECEVAASADVLILAVKPQMMQGVLEKIASSINGKTTVITIAAGKTTDFYENILTGARIVRIMPNINAKVNCAVSALCGGRYADEGSKMTARKIFETVGTVFEISENLFPAFSALGGASGAFVLMMIDSMASAGVKAGLTRKVAFDVACQVVMGSAKLAAETGTHPCELVDQICSPGGTTIEGVHVLKKKGFESAVIEGIDAIIEKDKKLAN